MIRATGAKLCMLASESNRAFAPLERDVEGVCEGDEDVCGEVEEFIAIRQISPTVARKLADGWCWGGQSGRGKL